MCIKSKVVAMVFRTGQGNLKHNFCHPCHESPLFWPPSASKFDTEPTLAVFNSKAEAEKAGWLLTSDPKWCPCHLPIVWVCPDCVANPKLGEGDAE